MAHQRAAQGVVRSAFDLDTLQIMSVALDCAWYKLLVSGSALTASWRAEHTREALALQIVASARLGERDVGRLCEDALAHAQSLVSGRTVREGVASGQTQKGTRLGYVAARAAAGRR